NFGVVRELDCVALCLEPGQLRVGEGAAAPVQIRVREVGDVVDNHRMVRLPGHVDWDDAPRVSPLDFGYLRHFPLSSQLGGAGEEEDEPVFHLKWVAAELELGELFPEQVVRDMD